MGVLIVETERDLEDWSRKVYQPTIRYLMGPRWGIPQLDAEEITNTAVFVVWQKREQTDHPDRYLGGVIRNKAADYWKSKRHSPSQPESDNTEEEIEDTQADTLLETLVEKFLKQDTYDAISKLPPLYNTLLRMLAEGSKSKTIREEIRLRLGLDWTPSNFTYHKYEAFTLLFRGQIESVVGTDKDNKKVIDNTFSRLTDPYSDLLRQLYDKGFHISKKLRDSFGWTRNQFCDHLADAVECLRGLG